MSCSLDVLYDLFIEEIIRPNLNYIKSSACDEPVTTWATLCNEAFKYLKEDYNHYKYSLFPRYYCFKDDNENKCIVKNVIVHDDVISQNLMSCYTREKIISRITMGPCENYNEISIYRLNSNVLWVFKKIQGIDSFSIFKRYLIDEQQLTFVKTDLLNSNLPISISDEADIMRMMSPLFSHLSDPNSFRNNILKRANDIQFNKICYFVLSRPHYSNDLLLPPMEVTESHHSRKKVPVIVFVQVNETNAIGVLTYNCNKFVKTTVKYKVAPIGENSAIVVLKKDFALSDVCYKFHEIILNLSELYFPIDQNYEF